MVELALLPFRMPVADPGLPEPPTPGDRWPLEAGPEEDLESVGLRLRFEGVNDRR